MYQIITEGENRCWLALELLGTIAAGDRVCVLHGALLHRLYSNCGWKFGAHSTHNDLSSMN